MKIDWSTAGWRIFPDDVDFSKPAKPSEVISRDIRLGPIVLQLGHGNIQNKGWVYVPDFIKLELV